MRLGRDSAYGVFAVVQLATEGKGSSISAEHLAEATGIPLESLKLMLTKLVTAKIVRRQDGSNCDDESIERYTLARAPNKITLLQIVEAIEGRAEPDLVLPIEPVESGLADTAESRNSGSATDPPPLPQPAPASNIDADWPGPHTLRAVTSLASTLLRGSTIADLVATGGSSTRRRNDDPST